MKSILSILLLLFLFLSCKKEELIGDKVVLQGSWNWTHTEHSYGWCQYNPQYKTINSSTDENTYEVVFQEKGKVIFFKNDEKIKKGRIVFEYFEMISSDEFIFFFNLDNKPEQGMSGSINKDTLRITYPYVEDDPNCENYLNFFVRE